MKLISLIVNHFRGIEYLNIDAQGRNVNIYGPNGAGKTTAYDTFLELLFGKDSADKKDYDLIPHKPGSTEPDIGKGKEPTVEATLEYFGKTVKLKKSYIEEWPKKGEFKGQYTGSKMHFFVDDLEVKAGEYQKVVDELIDASLFKLITNPRYFSETLSWQERRGTLVKMAGELNVAPAPELTALMGERPFDNFFALANQNVKAKQKELDGIPFAIKEARRMIPSPLPVMPDLTALSARKSELEEQLQSLKNDDSANAQRREIAQIETDIAQARNRYQAAIDAENAKIKAGIEKLSAENGDKKRELFNFNCDIASAEDEIKRLSALKSRKLSEWHEANDRQWTGSEICPTCGQPLPSDQIESARAAFNRQRSEDLERLKYEGIALKTSIEEKQSTIEKLQTTADTLDHEIAVLDMRIEKGQSMVKPYDFESTVEYETLNNKLNELKTGLELGTDHGKSERILSCQLKISEIKDQIDSENRIKLQIEQAAEQQKHVDELMEQEKSLNAEISKWEKAVSLCKQHVKNQAKALETAVNGKFKIARFQMFTMQKNGEEAECCDVVYPNGSTNLSTGEGLQTGIDIINTLTDYYGVTAPIWVDNAEGVTKPYETNSQIIRLIVSDKEKALRVEVVA